MSDGSFTRGLWIAVPISLVLWALIALGVRSCTRHQTTARSTNPCLIEPGSAHLLRYDEMTSRWHQVAVIDEIDFGSGARWRNMLVTGVENDVRVEPSDYVMKLLANDDAVITGLSNDVSGREIVLVNVGPAAVVLSNEDSLSIVHDRITCEHP